MVTFQPWLLQEVQLLGPTSFTDPMGYLTMPSHEKWEDVNKVWPLLDYCDYLAKTEVDIPQNEDIILTGHQGTILHLLCVGIDAWATGKWLDFGSWLNMGTREKNERYGLVRRNEMLKECTANVRNVEEGEAEKALLSGLREIYKVYDENFGKWHKFHDLFMSLPEAVKQILMEHYVIGENADPMEVEGAWAARESSENLALIAKYLWDWRRNKFTHQARADRASVPDQFKLFGEITHEPRGDGSVAIKAKWVVSSNVPEHILVRCALVSSIRQAVFNDVARSHVKTHLHELIRRYYDPEAAVRYIEKIGADLYG